MIKEEARNRMIRQLLEFKDAGLDVYINHVTELTDSHYGIITDGENIIYIQFATYSSDTLFSMSFEYVPSRKNGSGVGFIESKESLTMNDFEECVTYGRRFAARYGAELYRSFEQYMKDPWHKEHYEKL